MIGEIDKQFLEAKELRNKERQENAPMCKPCNIKTVYSTDCNDYICNVCRTHYSQTGSAMRFCVMCNWNKSNFSEMDAGEQWEEDEGLDSQFDGLGGLDWGDM